MEALIAALKLYHIKNGYSSRPVVSQVDYIMHVTLASGVHYLIMSYRSANIILVITIGTVGLLFGWLVELSTKFRQQTIIQWSLNFIKILLRRFRWGFVPAGFTALAMTGISWKLQTSQTYWIWHSIWHLTIYSYSFFMLCSKVDSINSETARPLEGNYDLTGQDSMTRGD